MEAVTIFGDRLRSQGKRPDPQQVGFLWIIVSVAEPVEDLAPAPAYMKKKNSERYSLPSLQVPTLIKGKLKNKKQNIFFVRRMGCY